MDRRWVKVVQWLVIAAMPFFLGFTTIRLIISDFYPRYEYAKESFPPDGEWTQAQRLELTLVAVDYLRRPQPAESVIYLLEEQRQPGSAQLLYNERETSHMVDVKRVTDAIRQLSWLATALVVGGLAALAVRPVTRPAAYQALWRGGATTTVLLLLLAVFIAVGWSVFFVQFHQLLFPPGTWTFAYTDSLIRLFPEKFWFDLGVLLSLSTLLEGVAVAAVGYVLWRPGKRAGER